MVPSKRPAERFSDAGAVGAKAVQAPDLCPLCGTAARHLFHPHGRTQRPRARCGNCGSLERHRLAWAYLLLETDLFHGGRKRMLHFAPERIVREHLEGHPRIDYLSGDLDPLKATAAMDITDIPHPPSSFDVIYCSHVLEHVPDDRRAMSEMLRVLRPGGWALLDAPMRDGETYEDPSITDPDERKRHFGQRDHVRWYGRGDFAERIRCVGFEVDVDDFARRELGDRLAARLGIWPARKVHLCRKPANGQPPPALPEELRPSRACGYDWTSLKPPPLGGWTPSRTVSAIVTIPPGSHRETRLTLAGLSEQTYPRGLTQVVVVDERGGCGELPEQADLGLDIERVRATGSAAGAAGAAAADGEILVFLNAQVVPDPRYLEAHGRWHHLVADAVTIGTLRHADPEGLSTEDLRTAARSGALTGLLGKRERWPIDEVSELMRPPEQLVRERGEAAGAMARGTVALRAETLPAAGGGLADAPGQNAELGHRPFGSVLFVPERKAIAWHTDAVAIGEATAALQRSTALAEEVRAWPPPEPVSPPGAIRAAAYRAKLESLRTVARRSPAAARSIESFLAFLRRGGGAP